MHGPGQDRSTRRTSWRPACSTPLVRAPASAVRASSSWLAPTPSAAATTLTWSTSACPPGSTHRRAGARAGRGACPVLARTGAHGAPAGGPACSCTWCAPGPVMRCADTLALRAILQHADGNRAGQRRARIEHLASVNVASHGHNINLVDVGTAPSIHIAVSAPGQGACMALARTGVHSAPAGGHHLQLHLVRARPGGQPAARRPATCAHLAAGPRQRRRPWPQHRPGRRPHTPQDPHRHAGAAMAPGPGACTALARIGAHGAPADGYHLQLQLVAGPGQVVRGADALALVASLQHADGNRAGQRRTRIEYLASVNVAGHGHNTTDRRQYRFPGSSSPCQRRNGAKAHAPPWPRPERTAHQLAAAICRCTWCPPGQVVSQQRAGRRSVRIEQLARANVAGHGHNINLVDVGTAPRIHIAVPAPRRRQGKARMRVRPCPGPERAAHGRPPFAGAVTC